MLSTTIIGAGGYAGAELVSILLNHPHARLLGLYASARRDKGDQPGKFDELFTRFRGLVPMDVRPADVDAIAALKPDCVFLATPHEASVELAPALADRGIVVLDLSAAFRLRDAALYPKHYGFEHHAELFRAAIPGADLLAIPGCYPTSAILPLAPLVRAGAVRPGTRPIIDSASGVSGAGRGANVKNLFCEVSLQPYNVLKHRHQPEIDAYAGCPTIFTPHLVALDRGILSTIHVELAPGWNDARVRDTLHAAYASEPFVRLCAPGVWPAIADVQRTNFCDIGLAVDESQSSGAHLIIASAIDNLVKGAAGQAVQAMNARFGLDETTGLLPPNARGLLPTGARA
jgi:N-acetyl-gamma-glutamyl-phosphate reductase